MVQGRSRERGTALLAAMLITMMVSALLVGVTTQVVSDNRTRYADRERTQAFYGAQAGLEQLVANVGNLFTTNYSPTGSQINALAATPPTLPGITFNSVPNQPGFHIHYDDVNPSDGMPDTEIRTISSGPYQGFVGLITQYTLSSTAKTAGNAEVRLSRTVQTVGIPVFQFGIFSENDLGFHAGDDFSFGGRVHSNRNIFIAAVSGATLTLADKVTAFLQIIRTNFANGRSTSSAGYTGNIRMAKAPGCPAPPTAINSACRNLGMAEGSLTGDVGSSANSSWTSLSLGTYNGYIRTGLTGATNLQLPLVRDGAVPIDIIRRPTAASPDIATVAAQRYYNMASLRILLSDTAAEITSLPNVVGTPVSLEAAAAGGYTLASSKGVANEGYRSVAGTPLVGGVILINKQDTAGNWTDVTNEILGLGLTGRNLTNGTLSTAGACAEPHPNAVIRIQRVKADPDGPADNCGLVGGALSTDGANFWPNVLYDPREGLRRDKEATNQNLLYLGGIMHYVEFDVDNYRRWIQNAIGASGPGSMNVTGYVVYFSDRRGNKNGANVETGEYGWEDFVNTDASGTPNTQLNTGEDMNGDTTLQTYGNTPRLSWATVAPGATSATGGGSDAIDAGSNVHTTRVNNVAARANRTVFFRRALKIVNGGLGSLPSVGSQGLTIASENPVYIQGNFNACGTPTQACASNGFGPTGDAHRSAAVIADSVTLLSRSWSDLSSVISPHNPSGRLANTTWYRTAIISGKGINFPHPSEGSFANFGSDGGAHNFLRFIENWSTNNPTIYYRGSMISFFYSRQAVGTWKCCVNVYTPPSRGASFDTEFLTPSLLPPRTPMFRDVNSTGFTQTTSPCGTDHTCGATP